MDYEGYFACDEAELNKIRSKTRLTNFSQRNRGTEGGAFQQIFVIIHHRGTKPHDSGFGGTFDRAWSSKLKKCLYNDV